MPKRFHALAGAAGALACGLLAAGLRLAAPPAFAAAAVVSVDPGPGIPAAYDLSALRALAASDAVLRKAALSPEAASAVAHAARPGPVDALFALFHTQPLQTDTLSRAVELLSSRIEIEPAADRRGVQVIARMDQSDDAAKVANAVAQAMVETHNETAAKIDRQLDQPRQEGLARAESRRDAARARLASLRAIDMTPTASIAAAQAAPDPAALALAEAQRIATAAEARRIEAARVYGPRHPEMIQAETGARQALAALRTARARVAATPVVKARPEAEGGPDPRLAELSEAQDEADRAETAYRREAAGIAAPKREARISAPAQPPAGSARPPAHLTIAGSALLGFLLFGAAPGLGARGRRLRAARPERPHALLRRDRIDPRRTEELVGALDIAATVTARRILVCGPDSQLARAGFRALADAALEQGWRPLIVETARASGAARGFLSLDGRVYATAPRARPAGDVVVARRAEGAPGFDADLAFDLVLFENPADVVCAQVAVWIGGERPPARLPAPALAAETLLWIAPA